MIPVPFIPARLVFAIVVVMLTLVLVAVRWVQPAWWSSRVLRGAIFLAFGAILGGLGLWAYGKGTESFHAIYVGAGIAYAGVLIVLPAALVMPVAAGLDRALVWVTAKPPDPVRSTPALAKAKPAEKPSALTRRDVIRFGAGSLPTMAAIAGGSGLVSARRAPTTPIVRMRYPDLHPDLEGLRILQLSDLHLGVEITLDDLENALLRARRELKPDLVVLTGDLADDTTLIAPALRMIHALGARYGTLASLGNHEYLHGIEITRPAYEESPIPLLVGTGQTLAIGRAKLFVGGADDPVHMGGDIAWMLTPSIESAIAAAPRDADFRLLLCHRPEGFDPATERGFDLQLSGHTHGGQLGFMGRSLLEKLKPHVRWWGTYEEPQEDRKKKSRLYTTSGFGHWFPFRFGCPTEMPLIVLTRS
jgi:hypothetical protein